MTMRAASPAEHELLRDLTKSNRVYIFFSIAWLGLSLWFAVLGAYYLVTRSRSLLEGLILLGMGVVFGGGYLYMWNTTFKPRLQSEGAAFDADVTAGQVDETAIDVVEVIEVSADPNEDEDDHLFLKQPDGKYVFLSGDYLSQPVAEQRFPAERVVVVRAPTSRQVIDFLTSGNYLAPKHVLKPFTSEERNRGLMAESTS